MSQSTAVNTTTNNLISMTPAAKARIVELLKHSKNKNLMLRIYVDGGCCSGFEYCFSFDEKREEDHTLIKDSGVEVIADPISIRYLLGTTLDYKKSDMEDCFLIINSKEKKGCDCSSSSCYSSCC